VASAGDVNGDGFADVIVGSAWAVVAYLYLGGAGGLSTTPTTLTGPGASVEGFGLSLAGAGDVNGDGFADIIVGTFDSNNGAAYVYFGGESGLSTMPVTLAAPSSLEEYFGISVGSAGDVNGDGVDDVVVGTSGRNAYVYLGGACGLSTTPTALTYPGNLDENENANVIAGEVASAGDVNGDGFADLIIGAPLVDGDTGAAYVYLGSASGPAVTPTLLAGPGGPMGYFGFSAASAGDVNGDGFADVIVGAYGVNGYGAAYVYLGSAHGLSTMPTVVAGPFVAGGGSFGWSAASAGDVNGDGFADVVVGDPDAETVHLYLGAGGGLLSTPSTLTAPTDRDGDYFGSSVASAGDVRGMDWAVP
jgi:hypothetical protein